MLRSWKMIAVAAIAAVAAPLAAKADITAESFVEENARYALAVLGDENLGIEEKQEAFRDFVEDIADVRRVTRFVLGRYARTVDEDDFALFSDAFREYAYGVYESRLGDFTDETFSVTGSTDRDGPADVVVHSIVSGGTLDQPIRVDWRVMGGPDEHRVVDVSIAGAWLAINQRAEVVDIIASAGGRVSAATEALQARVARN